MKRTVLLGCFACIFSFTLMAQPELPAVDKSPLDICYYPSNYPVLKIQDKTTGLPAARVIYSRPRKEGRTIFGGLVTYGQVWRLGANEATEIEFYQPVTIGDKKVAAGRYTLYAIVNDSSWTFIVNKDTDTWGAFKYDAVKDVARVDVPVQQADGLYESLTMDFTGAGNNIQLIVAWENLKVALPISF